MEARSAVVVDGVEQLGEELGSVFLVGGARYIWHRGERIPTAT